METAVTTNEFAGVSSSAIVKGIAPVDVSSSITWSSICDIDGGALVGVAVGVFVVVGISVAVAVGVGV